MDQTVVLIAVTAKTDLLAVRSLENVSTVVPRGIWTEAVKQRAGQGCMERRAIRRVATVPVQRPVLTKQGFAPVDVRMVLLDIFVFKL